MPPNSSEYAPDFFSSLYSIEDRHFWFRSRNKIIGKIFRDICQSLVSDFWILELGCGTGNVLRVLKESCPNGNVIGVDLFEEGLSFARKRTDCSLVQGDLHQPPFCTCFDIVGLFDVIEHIQDDIQVFFNLHHVLRPGGRLILTVPAHPQLWSYFDNASHHVRRYTENELRSKLGQSGYHVDFLTPYMTVLYYPLKLWRTIQALKNRFLSKDKKTIYTQAEADLKIIPIINSVMGWLTIWEVFFISRRKRLPIGTSFFIIAHHE